MKINQVSPLEQDFTEVLETLALNVKMLYFYGNLPKNADFGGKRPKTVAIVGARRQTAYGEEIAYKAAYECAKAGAVVVSGLAHGIDSIAHKAALDAGGITIAVLGTPIDKIYPTKHTKLAREIVESGGAVVSEIPAGGEFRPKVSFLERNRIIAGLSDAVLVVEAADRSGTLNTATHALNQGVDLFAVPGDIDRANSRGCNKLINQGAYAYTEPLDLIERLFPARCKSKKARAEQLSLALEDATETDIVSTIASGVKNGEEIIVKLGISASLFAQKITILEIKGVVRPLGANNWMIK